MSNDARPLVSIITPAYNAAAYLPEAAASVLAQTFTDFEWIIADDGSSDDTITIARALDDRRVRVVEGEHSGLPATARNRALAHARGELVAFLDADDVWLPEKLAKQVAYLQRTPNSGLVFTAVLHRYEQIGRIAARRDRALRRGSNPRSMLDALWSGASLVPSSVLLRRALLTQHGAFDEDPRQKGTEDFELFLRLAAHARFGWIDEPLVHYRISSEGLSASAQRMTGGRLLAMEKFLAAHPDASRAISMDSLREYWQGLGELRSAQGDCGRRRLFRAIRLHPANAKAWFWWTVSLFGARAIRLAQRLYRHIM